MERAMQLLLRLSKAMAVPQGGPCRLLSNRVIVAIGGHIWPDNKKTMKPSLNFSAELVPVAYAAALLDLVEELGVPRAQLFAEARGRAEGLGHPPGRVCLFAFSLGRAAG